MGFERKEDKKACWQSISGFITETIFLSRVWITLYVGEGGKGGVIGGKGPVAAKSPK